MQRELAELRYPPRWEVGEVRLAVEDAVILPYWECRWDPETLVWGLGPKRSEMDPTWLF